MIKKLLVATIFLSSFIASGNNGDKEPISCPQPGYLFTLLKGAVNVYNGRSFNAAWARDGEAYAKTNREAFAAEVAKQEPEKQAARTCLEEGLKETCNGVKELAESELCKLNPRVVIRRCGIPAAIMVAGYYGLRNLKSCPPKKRDVDE